MELETARAGIESQLSFTKMELEHTKQTLLNMTRTLDDERRDRRMELDDANRRLEREIDDLKRRARDEVDEVNKRARGELDALSKSHRDEVELEKRKFRDAVEIETRLLRQQLEDEKAARTREVHEAQSQAAKVSEKLDTKWIEIRQLKEEIEFLRKDVEREKLLNSGLRVRQCKSKSTLHMLTFLCRIPSLRMHPHTYQWNQPVVH